MMIPLERVRQRKLFQWGVAFLAAAWLVLQVLDLLAQPFAWPGLVMRAATVLFGAGFVACWCWPGTTASRANST